jgi:hypothetical protein
MSPSGPSGPAVTSPNSRASNFAAPSGSEEGTAKWSMVAAMVRSGITDQWSSAGEPSG